MRLDLIQELNSVNEIYSYVLRNSTSWESINKNLKKSEWFEYGLDNFHIYLCNKYVNKNECESSLDFLFISNAKAFKLIYTNDDDLENHIQQSRVIIYYLFIDYFEGIYDNEVYRNFGFRINGDIEQFKKLFLKENVDMFCSHLLTKAKQDERKQLSNRIVKAVKDIEGNYKTVVEYENYNFVSYEESFNENKQDIDSYLYKKGELEEEEIIEPFKSDNIYSFMCKNLHLLTDKQREFVEMYKDTEIDMLFKTHDCMSKELKYKYKKNIVNRFESKLLMNSKYIKKTKKNYYILLKSDNSFLLSKIFECKDKKEQFELIAKYLKRSDEIGRLINEIVIEQDCMKVFTEYFFNEGFTKDVMRFLYGRKFELILNRLDKGDDEEDVSRENRTVKNCI